MKKILITAPVHQDIKIFKEYLWSLNNLIIPENYEVYKYFYLDNAGNLKKFLQPNEYEIFEGDKLQHENIPHEWTKEKLNNIALMRSKALEYARKNNFDYIFNVDTDIILHKETLIDLLNKKKDFIGKIYWTAFNKEQPWNMIPNCCDDYIRNQKTFKYNLITYKFINTYEVGCISGVTLISSKIFNEPSLNYLPISILSPSIWEDYSFCVKCKCFFPGLKIYMDTIHPAKHLYSTEDYNNWMIWEKKEWK